MTLSADAKNVMTNKELLLLLFWIGILQHGLSDDEKSNVRQNLQFR